tara:strand:- start:2520 stop:2933 length:414 start_codon:yes stop_codon:yes gene_type:complete
MVPSFCSQNAPEPVGLYPHAKKVGNLLFLSGVGPRKRNSLDIPGVVLSKSGSVLSYCIEKQCISVFENIKVILEESGSCWDNIIDVTTFLTNMKDDFNVYNRIYGCYFKKPFPARTTIEINKLPTPIAIELKIIATI